MGPEERVGDLLPGGFMNIGVGRGAWWHSCRDHGTIASEISIVIYQKWAAETVHGGRPSEPSRHIKVLSPLQCELSSHALVLVNSVYSGHPALRLDVHVGWSTR